MTIGYEGLKPEDFLDKLLENKVSFLIDVRQNPNSRKQGFSKSQLEMFLEDNDIHYLHFQELGTPKELRQNLKDGLDYEAFFKEYEDYLRDQGESLESLKGLVEKATCCLMCFEKNYQECHRQVISSAIEEMLTDKIEVRHI
jgi:uncharacterized protein (DUF488 family)